jgi:hypothetical protein
MVEDDGYHSILRKNGFHLAREEPSMSRILLLTAFTVLTFTFVADGQDLKDAAARQKIAAQKLTSDVNDALDASRKLDPRDAKTVLRDLLSRVNDSSVLQPTERADLARRLNARIRVLEDAIRDRPAVSERPIYRDPETPKSSRPPVGNPGGASDVAKKFTDQAKSVQQAQADLIRQREKGITGINLAMEKSGVIPDRDIAFPADWKERGERMKKLFGPQLTEKEVKVLKTLNSTLSVKYDGESLATCRTRPACRFSSTCSRSTN